MSVCVLEHGEGLRDIVVHSAHIFKDRLVLILLRAPQLLDVYTGLVRDFEDRDDLLEQFRVGISFVGPTLWKMICIEVIDHALHVLLF